MPNHSKVFPPGSLALCLGAVVDMVLPLNAVNLIADKLYLPSISTREAVYMYLTYLCKKWDKILILAWISANRSFRNRAL